MRRHWELKQDAVDAFVCVQLAKNPQDTLLSNISGQVFATKSHSRLLARFPLSTNVKERVWSITDDYGREPGWKVSRWIQFLRAMLWAISAFQRAAWRRPSNRRARPVHESGGMVEKYLTGSYAPRRFHGRRARRQLIAPLWQCQPSAGLGCRDMTRFRSATTKFCRN